MRFLLDTALLLAVLFAPLSIVAILALLGMYMYPRYIEGVVALFLFDLLYGGGGFAAISSTGIMLPLVSYALIVFFFGEMLRTQIRKEAI